MALGDTFAPRICCCCEAVLPIAKMVLLTVRMLSSLSSFGSAISVCSCAAEKNGWIALPICRSTATRGGAVATPDLQGAGRVKQA